MGGKGHRGLWQRSISTWQCHYPSPILRQWLGPDINFSLQGYGAGRIQQEEFKVDVPLKRDVSSRNPGRHRREL